MDFAQWCRICSLVHISSLSLFAPILFSQGEGIGIRPILGVVEGGGQFPLVVDAAPAGLLPTVLAGEVALSHSRQRIPHLIRRLAVKTGAAVQKAHSVGKRRTAPLGDSFQALFLSNCTIKIRLLGLKRSQGKSA